MAHCLFRIHGDEILPGDAVAAERESRLIEASARVGRHAEDFTFANGAADNSILFSSAENRHLSATDTSATVLLAMSEAGNPFTVPWRNVKQSAGRGEQLLIGRIGRICVKESHAEG